ncbi:unnamed protein product [Lactuca saligna]|uniref:Uncharacterized protein n=1 Tax=Lactuca saligna TaxID=75948 RepID=A0AA35V7K0_LACSI|nr:unnamed protein product [Lactuca saligna]
MLCYVQSVSPDFGPMQGTRSQSVSGLRSDAGGKAPVSPDFGPMQGTRSQSVSGLWSDAGGKALVSPDFGPMQGTRSQSVSGLRSDVGGKAPVSPDIGPMQWARPSMCFICFCMVCVRLGELTKLRAYGFQFWFQLDVLISTCIRVPTSLKTVDEKGDTPVHKGSQRMDNVDLYAPDTLDPALSIDILC